MNKYLEKISFFEQHRRTNALSSHYVNTNNLYAEAFNSKINDLNDSFKHGIDTKEDSDKYVAHLTSAMKAHTPLYEAHNKLWESTRDKLKSVSNKSNDIAIGKTSKEYLDSFIDSQYKGMDFSK